MKMPGCTTLRKRVFAAVLIAVTYLFAGAGVSLAQTCTQTLSPGANLSTAITSAAAGSTICLNSGSYGSVSLSNVTKSPRVTVRSVTGQGATFSLSTTNGANGFTFDSVTLSFWSLSGSSTRNITVQNTRFTGRAQLSLCGVENANILIDRSSFVDINATSDAGEGRLHIAQPACLGSQSVGVTVTNSLFQNTGSTGGESDGIQVGAYGVVIGPGNTFKRIRQDNYTRHVDAIQLYGQRRTLITGNFFDNNSAHIGAYDGGNSETVTNNVFVCGSSCIVSLRGHSNDVFTHNTVIDSDFRIEGKSGTPSNMTIRDNLFDGQSVVGSLSCTNCTITHNQFAAGSGFGTNNILGAPTFVGGSTPTSWAGYQLASGSIGENDATDGTDMGTVYYGPGTSAPTTAAPPAAPTNVRVGS
jgi:hypothetical protein